MPETPVQTTQPSPDTVKVCGIAHVVCPRCTEVLHDLVVPAELLIRCPNITQREVRGRRVPAQCKTWLLINPSGNGKCMVSVVSTQEAKELIVEYVRESRTPRRRLKTRSAPTATAA